MRSRNNGSEAPTSLKSSIGRKHRKFSGYAQQDSQEFLVNLLEGISEDLNRVRGKPKYKELDYDKKKSMQFNSDDWYNYNLSRENSLVTDYFSGQFVNKIVCQSCDTESVSFDNFMDISLSFPKSSSSCSVESMFDLFVKKEEINDFYCSSCKKHRRCTKELQLYKLPNILVLFFKRFSFGGYSGSKIGTPVAIPES